MTSRSRFALLALLVPVAVPALVAAQGSDTTVSRDTVILTPIAVTATRSPKDVFLTPAPVEVFDRAAIAARAPNSVADLFRGVAGLDVSGVGLSQIRPIIRGQRGQRVLLLADGLRLNNSRRQQDFGEIPALVDVGTVERVEVVRGPGSVLYGSDAIGGVVNVITRSPQLAGFHGALGGRYSSADEQQRVRGTVAGRFGRWAAQLGGSVRQSEDYSAPQGDFGDISLAADARVHDSRGEDWTLDAYLAYQLGETHEVFAKYERYDADTAGFGYVDPAAYSPGAPTIRITYPVHVFNKASVGYRASALRTPFADRVELIGYVQDNERKLNLDITIPDFAGPGSRIDIAQRNWTDLRTWGVRAEARKLLGGGVGLTYGIDYFRDRSDNTDTSTTTFTGPPIPPSADTMPTVPNATYRSAGIFAQGDVSVAPRLSLILGARYQWVRAETEPTPRVTAPLVTATDHTVVGSAGAVYRVSEAVSAVATVGRAFRSPNLVERFYNGLTPEGFGYQSPNPDLKAETSLNVDLGVRARTGRLYAEAFVFQNDLRDGIRIEATGDSVNGTPEYQNVNVDRLRFRGVEVSARVSGPAGFTLGGALTQLDSEDVLDPNNPVGESFSTSYRLSLRHDDARDRFFAEYELRGNGARKDVLPGSNPVGTTLPAFTVHTVRAGATVFRRGLHTQRLGIAVRNLTDELYAEFSNVGFFRPEPGRTVLVTYDVTF
jgi:hemoglobin/transferrin/lactoferrin receptor protein